MASATRVSSALALTSGIGRRARIWSSDSGMTSRAPGARPAGSSRSRSRTPVHSAVPIAPRPHWVPSNVDPNSSPSSTRRLPAHSMVRITETNGNRFHSSS